MLHSKIPCTRNQTKNFSLLYLMLPYKPAATNTPNINPFEPDAPLFNTIVPDYQFIIPL